MHFGGAARAGDSRDAGGQPNAYSPADHNPKEPGRLPPRRRLVAIPIPPFSESPDTHRKRRAGSPRLVLVLSALASTLLAAPGTRAQRLGDVLQPRDGEPQQKDTPGPLDAEHGGKHWKGQGRLGLPARTPHSIRKVFRQETGEQHGHHDDARESGA